MIYYQGKEFATAGHLIAWLDMQRETSERQAREEASAASGDSSDWQRI
jgi:hypothetical protein